MHCINYRTAGQSERRRREGWTERERMSEYGTMIFRVNLWCVQTDGDEQADVDICPSTCRLAPPV